MVDMMQVASHYAISSLFESYGERTQIHCYAAQRVDFQLETEGKMHLVLGRAQFGSQITRESSWLSFAALHMGDHNIVYGVRPSQEGPEDQLLKDRLTGAFSRADTAEIIRLLDEGFGKKVYSLRSIFRDEQRKILRFILEERLTGTEAAYRTIYESHAPLIYFLNDIQVPIPKALQSAAEIALNSQLRQAFRNAEPNMDGIRGLLKEASSIRVNLDHATLEFSVRKRVEEAATEYAGHSSNLGALENLIPLLELCASLPFPVNLWEVQNTIYAPLIKAHQEWRAEADKGNPEAQRWLNAITAVSEKVGMNLS
jgi:hypothetical protein